MKIVIAYQCDSLPVEPEGARRSGGWPYPRFIPTIVQHGTEEGRVGTEERDHLRALGKPAAI
jgi:hypothetical protein